MEQLSSSQPQHIGGYHLLGRLGAGGMGEVFLARSGRGRTVAVKVVRPELAEQDEFRSRFRQEVRAARRVGGQWTAPVLDADTEATVPWVATGYIAGPSLHHVVARSHGPLAEQSVRVLAAGLAYALRDIHAAGLVHRDLKPSNVLVTIDGPRVIDFGIARALETVPDGGLTRTGAVVGSPGFMAPEQVRGQRVTSACDIFCLGSVLAYAATGTMPFGSAESGGHALMYRIAEEEPDLSEVPEGILELVSDCLQKDPARRPTPEQILQRTDAESTMREGRVREPWLPSALLAELARHAVGLLDREHEAPPEGPSPRAEEPSPSAGSDASGAIPEATSAGGPAAATPPGGPGDPGRERPPHEGAEGTPPVSDSDVPGRPPRTAPEPAPAGDSVEPAPSARPVVAGYPSATPYPPAHSYPSGQGYGPLPHSFPSPATHTYPPGGSYGHGQQPPRPRRRAPLVVGAVAVAVALVVGGVVTRALLDGSGEERPDGARSPAASPDQAAESPDPQQSDDDKGPTPGPSESAEGEAGEVPEQFLGTWRSSFAADGGGSNTRTLTIRQGQVGEQVMTLVGRGPDHDCRWSATLRASGPPLELNDSKLTEHTRGYCSPGQWSRLTLRADGTLTRELVGSGGEPLTYRRAD